MDVDSDESEDEEDSDDSSSESDEEEEKPQKKKKVVSFLVLLFLLCHVFGYKPLMFRFICISSLGFIVIVKELWPSAPVTYDLRFSSSMKDMCLLMAHFFFFSDMKKYNNVTSIIFYIFT